MQAVNPSSTMNYLIASSARQSNPLIDKVKNCFRLYQTNLSSERREQYFKSLHEVAQIKNLNPAVLDNPIFIDTARGVVERTLFPQCGPQLVLASREYKKAFVEFEHALLANQFDEFRFQTLVAAHNQFIVDLSPEYTAATKDLLEETPTNFPNTLGLFRETLQERLISEDRIQWREWVRTADPNLAVSLPKYALCRLLSHPEQLQPELMNQEELASIRLEFSRLKHSEKQWLLQRILGQDVQITSQILFERIVLLGGAVQLENRTVFSNILRILTEEFVNSHQQ